MLCRSLSMFRCLAERSLIVAETGHGCFRFQSRISTVVLVPAVNVCAPTAVVPVAPIIQLLADDLLTVTS